MLCSLVVLETSKPKHLAHAAWLQAYVGGMETILILTIVKSFAFWQLGFWNDHVPSCHRDLEHALPSAWNTFPSSLSPEVSFSSQFSCPIAAFPCLQFQVNLP